MQGISGSDLTVIELVERYISLKTGVKQSTIANYKTVINTLKKTEFAFRHVDQVKLSDAKMYLISLQRSGLGYSSIHNIRGVIRPAFQMAVDFDKEGKPMVALHWEKYIQHVRDKYNREHALQLPPITPHICRHTFCSNMARQGMNPKTLQYIMGHSDIAVTMNVYTHLGLDDAREELVRLKEARNVMKIKSVM